MATAGALHLTKYHGAGNDFLVVVDPDGRRPLSAPEVRALCDRHRGVGADGILRLRRVGDGTDLTMDLHNADGGVAEMSGNGIRCLVQAAVAAGWVTPGTVSVTTGGGVRHVDYRAGASPALGFARVDMGLALLGPDLLADLPADIAAGVARARSVDMGNPHIVLFGGPVDDATVADVGPRLERSVEGRANVEFIWPGPDTDTLTLRVWERGVGETLACGTGTCAAGAAAAHDWGLTGSLVRVANPGGTLEVELRADGISLAGPTQRVAEISVDAATLTAMVEAAAHGPVPAPDPVASGP